jgi:hypothetical protein
VIFFISGHLDLTELEFADHYIPQIELALRTSNPFFVVGDAKGADSMAQDYLKFCNCENVMVFHMFTKVRYNAGFDVCGGFKSDLERDEAMTLGSSLDIAWIRPGREHSGTAKNLKRRIEGLG